MGEGKYIKEVSANEFAKETLGLYLNITNLQLLVIAIFCYKTNSGWWRPHLKQVLGPNRAHKDKTFFLNPL